MTLHVKEKNHVAARMGYRQMLVQSTHEAEFRRVRKVVKRQKAHDSAKMIISKNASLSCE